MQELVKTLVSALILTAASEVAKRSVWMGAILVSLPLTSLLAMIWLYQDTRDASKVAQFSSSILWMVLPSLFFFWVLPQLLKLGIRFPVSLMAACVSTALVYAGFIAILGKLGIKTS